jgi:hypothetical protein
MIEVATECEISLDAPHRKCKPKRFILPAFRQQRNSLAGMLVRMGGAANTTVSRLRRRQAVLGNQACGFAGTRLPVTD